MDEFLYGEGSNEWVNASLEPLLLGIDVRAFIIVALSAYTTSLWIIGFAFLIVVFFGVIGKLGFNFVVAYRRLRAKLRGAVIDSYGYMYLRTYQLFNWDH
jgi:O-antigen ligase